LVGEPTCRVRGTARRTPGRALGYHPVPAPPAGLGPIGSCGSHVVGLAGPDEPVADVTVLRPRVQEAGHVISGDSIIALAPFSKQRLKPLAHPPPHPVGRRQALHQSSGHRRAFEGTAWPEPLRRTLSVNAVGHPESLAARHPQAPSRAGPCARTSVLPQGSAGRACIQGIIRHRGLSIWVSSWLLPWLDSRQLANDSLQGTPATR
jgi:hypothetical protein